MALNHNVVCHERQAHISKHELAHGEIAPQPATVFDCAGPESKLVQMSVYSAERGCRGKSHHIMEVGEAGGMVGRIAIAPVDSIIAVTPKVHILPKPNIGSSQEDPLVRVAAGGLILGNEPQNHSHRRQTRHLTLGQIRVLPQAHEMAAPCACVRTVERHCGGLEERD